MTSNELFYILIIIILVLHLFYKKEGFMNLRNDHKEKIKACCNDNNKGACSHKPPHLKKEDCEEYKKNTKNKLNDTYKLTFKQSSFHDKRPQFEPPKAKPIPVKERQEKIVEAIKKKPYVSGVQKNLNNPKPGFFVKNK